MEQEKKDQEEGDRLKARNINKTFSVGADNMRLEGNEYVIKEDL